MKKTGLRTSVILAIFLALSSNQVLPESGRTMNSEAAILPFDITIISTVKAADAMEQMKNDESYSYQNKFYSLLLKKKTLTHDIQDVEKTNALLIKSKIDRESIKGYTSSELAALLGVKKIIKGKISRKEQSAVESLFVAHSASVDISIYGDDDKLIWKFNDDKYSKTSSEQAVEKVMQKALKDIPL